MIQSFCFFPVVGNPFAITFIHDSNPHTNEGPFSEAHGAVTDDCFTDRLHTKGEGMQALRLLPEYGE